MKNSEKLDDMINGVRGVSESVSITDLALQYSKIIFDAKYMILDLEKEQNRLIHALKFAEHENNMLKKELGE